jgi:hypothetical protein
LGRSVKKSHAGGRARPARRRGPETTVAGRAGGPRPATPRLRR